MKNTILFLSIFFSITLVSCGTKESDEESKKTASVANKILALDNPIVTVTINPKQILDKSNVFASKLLKENVGMMADMVNTSYIADDNKLGINWNQNVTFTFFGKEIDKSAQILGLVQYEDEDKLTEILKSELQLEVNKIDGVSVAQYDPNTIAGWSDGVLAILYFTKNTDVDTEKLIVEILKGEPKVENENFHAFMGEDHDLSAFFFVGNSMNLSDVDSQMTAEVRKELDENLNLANSFSSLSMDFLNGKIVTKSKVSLDKKNDNLEFDHPNGIDGALANLVSKNKVEAMIGLGAINLPKIIDWVIKYVPEKEMAEAKINIAALGLSIDDLKNMFTGQMAFGMSDFPKKNTVEYDDDFNRVEREDGQVGSFTFAANLTDSEKIVGLFDQFPEITKVDSYYYTAKDKDTIYYVIKDNKLIATSDFTMVTYNLTGSKAYGDSEIITNGAGNVFSFKIDGASIMNMAQLKDNEAASKLLPKFVKFVAYGNMSEATFEFVVDRSDKNILEYIIETATEAQEEGWLM